MQWLSENTDEFILSVEPITVNAPPSSVPLCPFQDAITFLFSSTEPTLYIFSVFGDVVVLSIFRRSVPLPLIECLLPKMVNSVPVIIPRSSRIFTSSVAEKALVPESFHAAANPASVRVTESIFSPCVTSTTPLLSAFCVKVYL